MPLGEHNSRVSVKVTAIDARSLYRLASGHATAPPRKFFSMVSFLYYPSSSGHVHITSGDDPEALPDFECGYLKTYVIPIIQPLHFDYSRALLAPMTWPF